MSIRRRVLLGLGALFIGSGSAMSQNMAEVAFSIQNDLLTWFQISNPSIQGTISVTGLEPNGGGNALAYDIDNNRLLFSHHGSLWGVDLEELTLVAGQSVAAGEAQLLSNGVSSAAGSYFQGHYYYQAANGDNSVVRMGFNGDGSVADSVSVVLPGDYGLNMTDVAFFENGDLWVSGWRWQAEVNGPYDSFLLHYTPTDEFGLEFQLQGAYQPVDALGNPGAYFNGIFTNEDGNVLYGYRSGDGHLGIVVTDDGENSAALSVLYTGAPFNALGDMTSGFGIAVMVPEPSGALMGMVGLALLFGGRRRFSSRTKVD
jgi:MYXO-CTERM domain-containing protein